MPVLFVGHDSDGTLTPAANAEWLPGRRVDAFTVSLPGTRERIRAALWRHRPDVVHVSWSFSPLDGMICRAAHRLGAGTVATFHLPYAPMRSPRARMLALLYRYHLRSLREVDRVIALSDDQATLLAAAGYPIERVTVIANCVDEEAVTPGPSPLKERLGARLVVGYMGRLDAEKRVPALVDAFLRLQWPEDHHLVVAGSGRQERRVKRLAEHHPSIHVLGLVTDAQARLDLLRGADIMVVPSTAEGLALSLLEAMAAGCAVVATDAGDDGAALGDTGILLPVRPLEPALSEALRRLGRDAELRSSLGIRARARVVTRYGKAAHLDRVLAVYDGVRRW